MASDHSHTASGRPANQALTPVPQGDRVFHFHEHAALWFSLGTGLLVMQIGAYLVPAVGTQDAVIAIVLGSLIGAGLLAWTARLGCQTGLASAGLMHAPYGSACARQRKRVHLCLRELRRAVRMDHRLGIAHGIQHRQHLRGLQLERLFHEPAGRVRHASAGVVDDQLYRSTQGIPRWSGR